MTYKRTFFYIILFLSLLQVPFASMAQGSNSSAVASLSEGLGTKQATEEARYLIFSYKPHSGSAENSYLYDWQNGNCRFEGKTDDASDLVVLFNTKNTGGATVYIGGKQVENNDIVKKVQRSFEDESYFLFTPIRIAKQEIKAEELDPEIVDSKKFHVLKVNTPSSKYKSSEIFVDLQSGAIYKWNAYDSNGKLRNELMVTKTKDVGGGLVLPTRFTDKLNGKTLDYPIVASLINIEPQKFKEP